MKVSKLIYKFIYNDLLKNDSAKFLNKLLLSKQVQTFLKMLTKENEGKLLIWFELIHICL